MNLEMLRARLGERLIPVGDWRADAGPSRSDFDLNPDIERPERILRPAAVLIPVIAHAEGATVLLTRRSDSLTSHSGQIAFPGGRLDPGETAVEAALREASEEIALDPGTVEVLGLSEAYETGTGFIITPVVGWLAEPPVVQAQEAEVADIFETPWDFLMDVANHRHESLEPKDGGPRRHYWAMPWQERRIWGVTAGIIRNLCARVHDDRVHGVRSENAA